MKKLLISALTGICLLLGSKWATGAEKIGQITQFEGKVEIVRGVFVTTPKRLGEIIEGNDKIRTTRGTVTIHLEAEGATLRLFENTEIKILPGAVVGPKKIRTSGTRVEVIIGRVEATARAEEAFPIELQSATGRVRIVGATVAFTVTAKGHWTVRIIEMTEGEMVEVTEAITNAEVGLRTGQEILGQQMSANSILITHLKTSIGELDILLVDGTHVRSVDPGDSILLTLNPDGTETITAVHGLATVVDREGALHPITGPEYDSMYVATAANGEKIRHPLSRKTYTVKDGDKEIIVPECMVYVPAGEFIMGEPGEGASSPEHRRYVAGFFIDRYEVTNAEYMEFVKSTGHRMPDHFERYGGKIPPGRENYPVTYVSWDDAVAFCNWCGRRLPTEAEWEKAASWDALKHKKYIYPWGNYEEQKEPLANWGARWGYVKGMDLLVWQMSFVASQRGKKLIFDGGATVPVSTYLKDESPYKVYDMAGNVIEWTLDWYDRYPGSPHIEPEYGEKVRVCRGGQWLRDLSECRTTIRWPRPQSAKEPGLGFRTVAQYPWIPRDASYTTSPVAVAGVVPGGITPGPLPPRRHGGGGSPNE